MLFFEKLITVILFIIMLPIAVLMLFFIIIMIGVFLEDKDGGNKY